MKTVTGTNKFCFKDENQDADNDNDKLMGETNKAINKVCAK